MTDLKGKTALVTGSTSGIGKAAAIALAARGAHVLVVGRDEQRAKDVVAEIEGSGGSASFRLTTLGDLESARELVEWATEAGDGHVDILVNNAGVAKSDVRAEDTSDEHWRFHMDVNVDGLFWCCRAFGRQMLEQKRGSIVNIGSMSGFIVNKPQPQSFYNASKAAVHHLTKSLAAEWGARGVRVNAVAPTYIETPLTSFGIKENKAMYETWLDMTPMHRVGQPEEIASVVLFLASEAASLLTGSIVLADGGYTCW